MDITKEIIQEAVKDAINDIAEIRDAMDNGEEIGTSFNDNLDDTKEEKASDDAAPEETADDTVPENAEDENAEEVEEDKSEENKESEDENPPVEETEVKQEVEDKIDENIDDNGKYNLFGIDIDVEKKDNKYNITLKSKKDGVEKTVETDSADIGTVFGIVEDFFNEVVMSECDEDECDKENSGKEDKEEEHEEHKEHEHEHEHEEHEDKPEDSEDKDNDDDKDEKSEDEDEDEEDLDSILSNYRKQYSDKVDSVFELGLMAKKLALDLIKDKLLANTMAELSDKQKNIDTVLASKMTELNDAKLNYLKASKLDDTYSKAYSVIASGIEELKEGTINNSIGIKTAENIVKRYNTILSSILNTKDEKVILAAIKTIGKLNHIIVAKKEESRNKTAVLNGVVTASVNNSPKEKEQVKPVFAKQINVLNKEAYTGNEPLLAGKSSTTVYDEMLAEIVKIAIK